MPKFNANLTMLFNEVPFLDRFQAAAGAGFKGVEFLFPYAFDKDAIAERLDQHGLVQVLHNLPAGDWDAGERGIACQHSFFYNFILNICFNLNLLLFLLLFVLL